MSSPADRGDLLLLPTTRWRWSSLAVGAGCGVVAVVLGVASPSLARGIGGDVRSVVALPIVMLATLLVTWRIVRPAGADPIWISVALLMRLGGTIANYVLTRGALGGGDALAYDAIARRLVTDAAGPGPEVIRLLAEGSTSSVVATTAMIYLVMGTSSVLATAIFAAIGWFGSLLLYRAVPKGVREQGGWPLAVGLLALPSLAFWPTAIGKDALVLGGLGLLVFGFSRWAEVNAGGWVPFGAGALLVTVVRPHVGALAIGSAAAASMLARSHGSTRPRTMAQAVIVVAATFAVAVQAAGFLQVEEYSADSVAQVVQRVERNTAVGTLQVEASSNPAVRVVSALFQPFPWQVRDLFTLVASIESLVLLVLIMRWVGRLLHSGGLRSSPLIIMSLIYSLGFGLAFGAFGNLGLLLRQRAQVLPFLVLLAFAHLVQQRTEDRLQPRSLA